MADGDSKETRIVVERPSRPRSRGSSAAARRVEELESEGARYRTRLREAKVVIENLTKKVPPEGSTVLNADQTKVWKVLQDRQLDTADKLTVALDKGEKLEKDLADRDLDSTIAEIAEIEGFPLGTLKDLVKARSLTPEVREELVRVKGEDGKTTTEKVRTAYLGTGKQGENPMKFVDYVETHATDYVDLLGSVEGDDEGGGEAAPTRSATTTTTGGDASRRAPQTSAARGGGTKTSSKGGSGTPAKLHPSVQRVLDANKARAEAPSVLRPAAPASAGGTGTK